ncbi:MAG: TauD/TfdA family dioxygenase [Acidimicrobiales bacterium]
MSNAVLTVRPAAGALGAVVEGPDLSRPLGPDGVDQLHRLLLEHLVLFFPGQDLDDDRHLQFALQFGEYYTHPIAQAANLGARAGHIVDDADHPPFQDEYHTDVSWDAEPPTFGILRMIDRPSSGGDTIFANMYTAYDRLSDTMKACLDGLTAWHDMGEGKAFRSKSGNAATDKAAELQPGAEHPVVGVHPVTGRKFLYVNRGFTRRICGMHKNESDALVRCLVDHTTNPNFQVRWNWSVGDVVLWDERCTQHFAVADHYPQRRETARVNVTSHTL